MAEVRGVVEAVAEGDVGDRAPLPGCIAQQVGAALEPATQQLEWTRGKQFSILEERKDLIPAYVVAVVRNGLHEMAPFRPTEIDDAALSELVAYLAPPKKVSPKKR
jgi:hypothetical protein